MSEKNVGRIIRPPSKLSNKVTIGGPGAVDEAALERAEQVISDLADSYIDWAREDLEKIQTAFTELKSSEGDSEALEIIFQISECGFGYVYYHIGV